MKQDMIMNDKEFGELLANIPYVISGFVQAYINTNHKVPRFPSVLKYVKNNGMLYGMYNYNKLSQEQKLDIEDITRDAFYGMKEAGF